jgi:hypothetical protein
LVVVVEAVAPTLTGDGCGVVEDVVVFTCVGALVAAGCTDVVEEETGATVDVVVDEPHPMSAGRQTRMTKMEPISFFISTSILLIHGTAPI